MQSILVSTVALALLAAPARGQDAETPAPRYALPDDPAAVVLSLDWRGGYAPPRESERPQLEVRADGTLVVPDRSGGDAHLTDRLSPDELQELLRFALDERRLLAFDAERVAAQIARHDDVLVLVEDAATTVVAVDLPGHRGEARFDALDLFAREHPDVRALQDLHAVSRRLQGLMFAVQAGGRASMDRLLAAANAKLVAREPQLAPLGLADVTHVGRAQDGTMTVRLVRRLEEDRHLVVTVTAPAEGQPSVEVRRT